MAHSSERLSRHFDVILSDSEESLSGYGYDCGHWVKVSPLLLPANNFLAAVSGILHYYALWVYYAPWVLRYAPFITLSVKFG